MPRKLRLVLVGVFFVLMFAYAGTNAYLTIKRTSRMSAGIRGWIAESKAGHVLVTSVDSDGPATELRADDEIIALDSQSITTSQQLTEFYLSIGPGRTYTVTIQRGKQQQSFTLHAQPIPFNWWASQLMQVVIVPLIFMLTGLAVFLLKPNDKLTLLLALMFGTDTGGNVFVALPPWLIFLVVAGSTASHFSFPLCFHFFLVFP